MAAGLLLAVFVLGVTSLEGGNLPAKEKMLPFKPKERLHYVLKWSVIPVGWATLTTYDKTHINGEECWHFSVTARSSKVVDAIYKVRDQVDAYADINLEYSVLYRQKQHEGSYQRAFEVTFDQLHHKATHKRTGKPTRTISIFPGTYDPLSAFFALRLRPLIPGRYYSAPVSDGKKCVIGLVHVVRREQITVEGKTYDTVLIEPELKHVGGIFKKSKDAKIQVWVTADHYHIPVKLASKVIVGHFTGELTKIENF